MTELTIPPDADEDRATKLVQEHVEVGDVIEIWGSDRTGGDDPEISGEVTGIEPAYVELDGQPIDKGSVRYDEIHTIITVEEG